MRFLIKHRWILILSLALSFLAGAYLLTVDPLYEVSATVVVHRQRVENPSSSGEDDKNRWIWVRDGMGLKESLMSDKIWISAIQSNPLLKGRYDIFVNDNSRAIKNSRAVGATELDNQISFSQQLMKQVSVDFTGGDSYSYVLRVKDKDPVFAKALVTTLIDRAQQKLIQESREAYENSLASLQSLMSKNNSPNFSAYLKDTEKQLRVSSVLFDSTSAQRVEVVQTPHVPLYPIWPKPAFLLILALLLGVTLGLAVEVSASYLKKSNAHA